jgi:hypothetical protein
LILTLASGALAVLSSAPVAEALPHDARIESVVQGACGATPCTPGSAITAGSVVGGIVRVDVHAEADLGLEWVRLEMTHPGSVFGRCLEFWPAGGARTFDRSLEWNTAFWTDPRDECTVHCSDCIEDSRHYHGAPSLNTTYKLRVVAAETGSDASGGVGDVTSPPFELKLQNTAAPPAWTATPAVARDGGSTSVTLEWAPSSTENAAPPEPPAPPGDVVEYRFLRIDAAGRRAAFAVDAKDPTRQGCQKIGTIAYRCHDRALPGQGTYRYAVSAIRSGFSGDRCELSSGSCVVGRHNDIRSVTVAGAASSSPTTSATPTPGVTPSSGAAPVSVDPRDLRAADPTGSPAARKTRNLALVAIAASMLVLGGAGAALRARAARRR